jgi:hypothetical protein
MVLKLSWARPLTNTPLILTMLATRNGAEGGLLCEASDLHSPTITPICVA